MTRQARHAPARPRSPPEQETPDRDACTRESALRQTCTGAHLVEGAHGVVTVHLPNVVLVELLACTVTTSSRLGHRQEKAPHTASPPPGCAALAHRLVRVHTHTHTHTHTQHSPAQRASGRSSPCTALPGFATRPLAVLWAGAVIALGPANERVSLCDPASLPPRRTLSSDPRAGPPRSPATPLAAAVQPPAARSRPEQDAQLTLCGHLDEKSEHSAHAHTASSARVQRRAAGPAAPPPVRAHVCVAPRIAMHLVLR